ncbi:PLP-dependent transferase [Patellaria atrata CBS 101060]|uniref:PLP-dependent transferase n=1 Tax=Patellaria atrata CBS 101060 TaxID=1346257 RepID=A0A9P4VPR9_9PEZI|nr:PLP-dependent transferase [Patellaria atrata CBS 101060]
MVKIKPFAIEQWMDKYQPGCNFDLGETCCSSISVQELIDLSEDKSGNIIQLAKRLDYGEIRGSDTLRGNLARLYSSKVAIPLPKENVLITPGAISANYLLLYTLTGPEDHVICHYPTYQQLYEVPKSLGAEVDLWKAKEESDWILDVEELKMLIKPNTKLIIINNPNNPTGAVLKKSFLQQIVDIATEHDIYILADEVYRPLFHGITPMDAEFPPSILSMGYKKAIATGSMSKAYSMAGLRVGWIASRDHDIIDQCAHARDYTTISVGQLNDQVAAFALSQSTVHNLLARNLQIAKTNKDLLEKFIIKHDDICEWVKPVAGTTAFVKFHRDGIPVDSTAFCKTLLEKFGVLFAPGDECFGKEFKGYIRIGYCCATESLKGGLDKAKLFLRKDYDDVPLVQ